MATCKVWIIEKVDQDLVSYRLWQSLQKYEKILSPVAATFKIRKNRIMLTWIYSCLCQTHSKCKKSNIMDRDILSKNTKKSKVDLDIPSKKYKNIEWYRQIYRRKIWTNQTMWTGNYSWQSTKRSINVDWDLLSENTKKTNNVDRDLFVQKQEKID